MFKFLVRSARSLGCFRGELHGVFNKLNCNAEINIRKDGGFGDFFAFIHDFLFFYCYMFIFY